MTDPYPPDPVPPDPAQGAAPSGAPQGTGPAPDPAGEAGPAGAREAAGAPLPVVGEADGGWHRVHPLTPAIRLWQAIVLLVVFVGQDWGQGALRGDSHVSTREFGRFGLGALAGGGALLLLAVAAVTAAAALSWRFTRFRVTEDALELHHGVLSRRQRRARLDRIQAVDVVQPLVARLVGLARLTVEVAGGSDSRVELSYLTQDQAQRLRNHLLARAAGLRYDSPQAPQAPERDVFDVPLARLGASLALSGVTLSLLVLGIGLVALSVLAGTPAPIVGGLPAGVGVGGLLWQRFSSGFGFHVATSPDGLRLRHGLLEHRTQTVPPGRVQAIRLYQPLLWRAVDWWRVEVNVAGYGQADDRRTTEHLLLPVGTRAEAVAVLSFVLPDLGVDGPLQARQLIDAGLSGSGGEGGFITDPPPARWVDPLAWRRNGVRVTRRALVIRRGRVFRLLDVVPHARTQSCGVQQGPLQRALGLASFQLHSTSGPVTPVVPHLAAHDAAVLLTEQAERAHRARMEAGPERWMENPAEGPGASPG